MKKLKIAFLFQFIIFFGSLSANIDFNKNYSKQIRILKHFDIDTSFMQDRELQKYISNYQSPSKQNYFYKAIQKASVFLPTVQRMLNEANVPKEFLYLAMAESQFENRAVSEKSASGMWQFMPFTAQAYGLRIDNYVDERQDILKSTEVAIKYLNELHNKFDKWYLSAIAYNCGEGRLRRAIKKAGTDDLKTLLNEESSFIPKESRKYIRKIVALAFLGSNESGFVKNNYEHLLNNGNTFSLAMVPVFGGDSLYRISHILNLSISEIRHLNPHVKNNIIPPDVENYNIYIPYSKLSRFKALYTAHKTPKNTTLHIVHYGDSLYKIGRQYGCSHKEIQKINNLENIILQKGQKLIVPIPDVKNNFSKKRQTKNKKYKISKKNKKSTVYLVKKGDTLHSIARYFETNIESIMKKNKLDSQLIRIGEKLIVTR
jgi:membrane-bound lytic murein transglycosylase D